MKIWVDADACPGVIKEVIIRAALRLKVETMFVANKAIYLQASHYLSAIQVGQGADVADRYIIEKAEPGDLVITQDIPLASELVHKKVAVISLHGTTFTEHNIRERLSIRNFMQEIRDTGGKTNGPKPFDQKDKHRFSQAFDQQLTKLLKK